jgi:hypothetical protein
LDRLAIETIETIGAFFVVAHSGSRERNSNSDASTKFRDQKTGPYKGVRELRAAAAHRSSFAAALTLSVAVV